MRNFNELIRLTLSPEGTRFSSPTIAENLAGQELLDCAENHLASLERYIWDAQTNSSFEPDQFGMVYVLGAFVVGSVREKSDEAFEFLKGLKADWLAECISSASTFFWKTRVGYSCKVAPTQQLIDFLSWCERHESSVVSEAASEVKEQFERQRSLSWP